MLGGRVLKGRLEAKPDFTHLKTVAVLYGKAELTDEEKGNIKYDGQKTFDKVTDVYYAGAIHEEKQPPHLKIPDPNLFRPVRGALSQPLRQVLPGRCVRVGDR